MFNDTHLPQSGVDGAQPNPPAEGPLDASVPAPRFSRLALCVTAASALTLGVVGTVAYGVWFEHDQQAYAEAMSSARQSLGMPAAANGLPVKKVVSTQAETPMFANTSATGAARASQDSSDPSQQSQQLENGSRQTVWSGQVVQAPGAAGAAVIAPAGLGGDTQLATPAASTVSTSPAPAFHSTRRAAGSSDSNAPQSASSRTVKATHAGQQERRVTAADAQQSARQNARQKSTLFARMSLFFRRVSYRQHGGANPQQQDIYSHP
jgi:hypothetical protein